MTTNVVCSDTYIDAFSKLDKKTQKKSLETIRLMQRSLRSDSLKIEKLNTKLDFKSVRITQDFRAIFTQSGNTVLLVYIDHHDNAYQWAHRRLNGFDAADAKPAYEYFKQSKKALDPLTEESMRTSDSNQSIQTPKIKRNASNSGVSLNASDKISHNKPNVKYTPQIKRSLFLSLFSKFLLFLLGITTGIIIMYFIW